MYMDYRFGECASAAQAYRQFAATADADHSQALRGHVCRASRAPTGCTKSLNSCAPCTNASSPRCTRGLSRACTPSDTTSLRKEEDVGSAGEVAVEEDAAARAISTSYNSAQEHSHQSVKLKTHRDR